MEFPTTPDQLGTFATMLWVWGLEFLPRLGTAIIVLVVGLFAASWASKGVHSLTSRTDRIDPQVRRVLATIVRYIIVVLVVVAALGQLGVQTTSLLAVLGAAGLAIGLALQGTLSNVSAGIMLMWLKPFREGDFIQVGGIMGLVKNVGLFTSQLDTFDGIYMFVPNAELWNKSVSNFSRNSRRLMSISIGISYNADVREARRILVDMAKEDERVLRDPEPIVFVESYGDSSVNLMYRVWAPNADFWGVQRYLIEEAKRRLEAEGIEIPFPQRVVHMMPTPGNDTGKGEQAAGTGPRVVAG